MIELFHTVSGKCSKATTKEYSTSFFSAIGLLHKDMRQPVYNIYGFVRLADEIVDTFHSFNKQELLAQLRRETFSAIKKGISLNPILNSFQLTVHKYNIHLYLIEAFFDSMQMDLEVRSYSADSYQQYIYGSAEVVGLMCLQVFCEGDLEQYEKLKEDARSLGAAFQKVNFLRDIKADYNGLNRVYFPDCDFANFSLEDKRKIETDIEQDFKAAYRGIVQLPLKSRFGVYVAYKYYLSLFRKIKRTRPASIVEARIRIPDYHKLMIIFRAGVKNQLNLI